MADNSITVKLAKFTRMPGARFREDSKFSAEEFRQEFLIPSFRRAQTEGKDLVVDLDGVVGIASSFMEEAFGGLARVCGGEQVLKAVKPHCDEDPRMAEEAVQFMSEEAARQKERGEMTLGEYVLQQKELADKFHDYWLRCQEDLPDQFPVTMTLSEWWEQTVAFEDSGCPKYLKRLPE